MKTINLAPGVSLPAEDFIESATGVLMKRGKGKSGFVKVVEEEMLKVHLPFVVFDPVGIHWGLKSSFHGDKPSGHEVLVVGGRHGDLPLVRKAGREVARSIADSDANLVIDLKGSPHAAYREFVTDFCDELLDINQRPRLQIFEEAHRLLPQKVRPDQTACLDAVQRTVTEGRNSALGALIVSQRPATVNKDTLTQVDNLILGGMTSPQDRKAVKEWVEQNAEAADLDKFLAGLAGLQTREGWLWIPDKDILQKFRTKDFTTFHPDRTHLRKLGLLTVKPAQTDVEGLVEKLGARMKAVVEEVKANDPAVLRAEIRDLKRQLTARQPAERVVEKEVTVEKQVPFIPPQVGMTLQQMVDRLAEVHEAGRKALAMTKEIPSAWMSPAIRSFTPSAPTKPAGRRVQAPIQARVHNVAESIGGPHQRILDAIAWFEAIGIEAPLKEAVAFKAGYRPGGGAFNNPLGALRNEKGNNPWPPLIQYGNGTVSLTADGRKRANKPQGLGTAEDLQREVLQALDGPMARILRVLLEAYPKSLTKGQLANDSGYAEGGGAFNNPLGRLRTCELVDYPEKGKVVAMPFLFLEA